MDANNTKKHQKQFLKNFIILFIIPLQPDAPLSAVYGWQWQSDRQTAIVHHISVFLVPLQREQISLSINALKTGIRR